MSLRPAIKSSTIGLVAMPIDPMFFRGGRPFDTASRGESGLPTPQTAHGMIKTHLMRRLGVHPGELHGLRNRGGDPRAWLSRVAVRGPWLAAVREGDSGSTELQDVFVPMPAHVVRIGDKRGDGKLELLSPLRKDAASLGWSPPPVPGAASPLRPLWRATGGGRHHPASGWLGRSGLERVLNGQAPCAEHVVRDGDLFAHEDRVGIALGGNGTAEDGMIYSVRMHRFTTPRPNGSMAAGETSRIDPRWAVGFYIEVGSEDPRDLDALSQELQESAILPFGGEGRRARVERLGQPWSWPKAEHEGPCDPEVGGFATILTTPAIWGDGALRDSEPEPIGGRFSPSEQAGTLVSLAMHKPVPISGWDFAGRTSSEDKESGADCPPESPRPTRYAIPAGSTVFWQQGKAASDSAPPTEWQLAQTPVEAAAGWGCALAARWRWWAAANG